MPESSRTHREFLPSAQQAIAELEEATGKPVLIVEEPELNVAATIRRARAGQTSHILRWKSGSDPLADYLITFECRMALREPAPNGSGAGRQAMGERPAIQERVIEEVEALYPQMPKAKARELGQFILNGLMLQLRSMGPGMHVDRWIREHCPDVHQGQERLISSQINDNLGALEAGSREQFPKAVYDASVAMNAAYAVFGGDLLGKPYLAVPYLSQGYGEQARGLIRLALGEGEAEPSDRTIIDSWARALQLEGWYDWVDVAG
jgi:hypothetical protein